MKRTVRIAAAVAAGVAAGAILGILLSKGGGSKNLCARGKKLEGVVDGHLDDDKASLQALRQALQHQLRRVDKRLQQS